MVKHVGNMVSESRGVEGARDVSRSPNQLQVNDADAGQQKPQNVAVTINGKEQPLKGQEQKKDMTEEEVKTMSEALNDIMDKLNCNIKFDYYEELGLFGVKMLNRKTQEVIKEFPPEQILEAMKKTKDWIGVFLDKKA